MPFERFTKVGARSFAPKVSIWARGQIGFNKGAVQKFGLDQFDFVILFFDAESRKIGVKFTKNAKEVGAMKIIKRPTGVSFSANSFLKTYGIEYTETTQYDLEFDKSEEMYIIDLQK